MRRSNASWLFLALTLAAAGCSRQVAVESEPAMGYAVEVENATTSELVVSFRDDRGVHELGRVRAGARERFVIAGASGRTVEVFGVNANATRTTRSRQVTLIAGSTVPVRLVF